ncbi:hypothetical protein [Xylanimonas protaetiae]|uniref:Uncharacterized protein n=1 Tax=Xylanimonas protaetiae TaxID=2509457 RepID=A0A4P6F884_9MICO|nr:hypothetical protein [Xylanimonas protaetiae]QAY69477.1 hypothetical protein ET471_05015 [Xylanimonas protaetiae]
MIVLPTHVGETGRDGTGVLAAGLMPAAAAAEGCTAPSMELDDSTYVSRDQWAASPLASVMALVGDRAPDNVWVRRTDPTCPSAVPSAVVYDPARSVGVNVYRNVAKTQETDIAALVGLTSDAPGGFEGQATPETIRGVTGYVHGWVNEWPEWGGERPRQRIAWVDTEGVRWYAVADGMTPAETITILDGLTFDANGSLDAASVPVGFTSAPTLDANRGAEPSYMWTVEYGRDTDDYVYLEITTPALAPIEAGVAAFADRLVDFDGRVARFTMHGQGGAQLAWVQDGAYYRLTAAVGSFDEMLALARTIQVVDPTDARLGWRGPGN